MHPSRSIAILSLERHGVGAAVLLHGLPLPKIALAFWQTVPQEFRFRQRWRQGERVIIREGLSLQNIVTQSQAPHGAVAVARQHGWSALKICLHT